MAGFGQSQAELICGGTIVGMMLALHRPLMPWFLLSGLLFPIFTMPLLFLSGTIVPLESTPRGWHRHPN